MDLTALIEFTSPGSVKNVARPPDGVEGDPWPGIAADDRAAFNQFFRDQVKARL